MQTIEMYFRDKSKTKTTGARMPNKYSLLHTTQLDTETSFYHPEHQPIIVHEEDSAMDVFTDFKSKPPETTLADKKVIEALEEMRYIKVKSLLVVDAEDQIIGLISSRDIQGIKVGQLAQENSMKPASVTVDMAMKPRSELLTIDIKDLSNARVGHIKRLMHELGVQHLLVTERQVGTNKQFVRGIFSDTRISRQLGEMVSGDLSSHSVSEMYKNLG